jgi:hypothetical protein
MNALANMGYLPRSGIVTIADLIKGQKDGYNIDYDLGAVLAAVAVGLDGDLLTTKVGPIHLSFLYHAELRLTRYRTGSCH